MYFCIYYAQTEVIAYDLYQKKKQVKEVILKFSLNLSRTYVDIAAITRRNPVKAIQPDSGVRLNSLVVVFFTPSSARSVERFHVPAAAQVYHRHLLINILPEKPVTPAEGSGAVESSYRFRFGDRLRR